MQFTDRIHSDEDSYHVAFTLVFTTKGKMFFVALRKDAHSYFFDMIQQGNKWVIDEERANWIMSLEDSLSEMIIQKLKIVDGLTGI